MIEVKLHVRFSVSYYILLRRLAHCIQYFVV
jgi:hypothetical protein